ncbi:RNA-binding S4 domain-containing protein [uncultured Flavobacterium sp.]|uniref:RNA-binding S4 domain-containing protein n=1 Tax=uncultured Flavobacterium sp. TaxID=165435 RepID=UPI0025D774AA|nr:RNA-binding S4 domain-containing protein [uncultured Flavobacterium sp.]
MRIDKYLWCTRYYKTRSLATQAIQKGHVTVNGQQAKASRDVFPSDKVTVRRDQINYVLSVLDIPKSRVGPKLVDIYRKDETPAEAFEHLEMLRLTKEHYRAKGTGRPTKKDRRDLDDYGGDFDPDFDADDN